MERTNSDGKRLPFQIVVVTADREAWRLKKTLLTKLEAIPPQSKQYHDTLIAIDNLDIGGTPLIHPLCYLSGYRGMHASKKGETSIVDLQKKNPNHWKNKTRNIILSPSEAICKIHIDLIVELNKQAVQY